MSADPSLPEQRRERRWGCRPGRRHRRPGGAVRHQGRAGPPAAAGLHGPPGGDPGRRRRRGRLSAGRLPHRALLAVLGPQRGEPLVLARRPADARGSGKSDLRPCHRRFAGRRDAMKMISRILVLVGAAAVLGSVGLPWVTVKGALPSKLDLGLLGAEVSPLGKTVSGTDTKAWPVVV